MTDSEAVRLLGDIVTTIASGQETSRQEASGSVRIGVEHAGKAVWLAKPKGRNAWVVTGYRENPDGAAAGRATSEPTSTAASLTRESRVAEFQEIVAQDLENGNDCFCEEEWG